MNSRRTVILLIAIVVSAVSALGLSRYVQGLEDDVYGDAALGSAYIVKSQIPKGTPSEQAVGQGLIELTEVPVEFIPASAIVDPNAELNNLVAVVDLPQGSMLVAGNFVAPNVLSTGITDRLEERGMVTVTFPIDQVAGVAGFVQPGDFVNMLVVRPLGFADKEDEVISTEQTDGATTQGGGTTQGDLPDLEQFYENDVPETADQSLYLENVRYFYQKAEVLAVGQSLPLDLGETAAEGEEAAAAATGGVITLAVPPEVVQQVLAVGTENLYLSLVPASYEPEALEPMDITELLYPAEDEARLTPYFAEEAEEDAPSQ